MKYPHFRRFVEILLVLLALPLALALSLILGCMVALESAGGFFFVQTRPGKHGRPFRMLKFRTMIVSQQEPFRLTEPQDARLTRTGRWLRAMHLDEIPQLWHVLTGEMSLVGPRPVPMELYAEYQGAIEDYDIRHSVVPGLTGLAQVCLGYVNTLEGEQEKWRYDVYYIAHRSPDMDAWILWATAARIFKFRVNFERMAARVASFEPNKNAP